MFEKRRVQNIIFKSFDFKRVNGIRTVWLRVATSVSRAHPSGTAASTVPAAGTGAEADARLSHLSETTMERALTSGIIDSSAGSLCVRSIIHNISAWHKKKLNGANQDYEIVRETYNIALGKCWELRQNFLEASR